MTKEICGKNTNPLAIKEGNMDKEEYNMLLKVKYEETDWDSLRSVQAYNAYKRMLRHLMEDEARGNS